MSRSAELAGTPAVQSSHQWWNRVTKTILSLGAVAAAIGAILSLWPAPDPEDSAQLTAIRVTSQVPLSEYGQRSRFGRDDAAAPTSSTVTSQTSASSAATSSRTPSSASATSPASATGPFAAAGRGFVVPEALKEEDLRATTEQALDKLDGRVQVCAHKFDCLAQIAIGSSVDLEGKPVAPAVAAERVVKVVRDARTIEPEQPTGKKEPVGVVVSADVELAGLRGKPVLVSWSMWQKGGNVRLHEEWLNRNLAYRLEATTNRDTTSVDLWVPLPRPPGPYFIRVDLTSNGSRLASGESELFD